MQKISDRTAVQLERDLIDLSESAFNSWRLKRLNAVQVAMDQAGIDALVLTIGADMPWLCGYEAMPLERITALVVPKGSKPTLVVPKLEAPRVRYFEESFALRPWFESEDPFRIIAELLGQSTNVAVSEKTWASWLIRLEGESKSVSFSLASDVIGAIRAKKDQLEVEVLTRAAHAADAVAEGIIVGEVSFRDRTERQVSAKISELLLEAGHKKVNFAIVGSGANSASPHHEPTDKLISEGEAVVCDFGGTYQIGDEPGYCSDTTRTFFVGEVEPSFAKLYDVLLRAQITASDSATVGSSFPSVDEVARSIIREAGYGSYFVHRLGHGIGLEEHELPYLAENSTGILEVGHAFSIEPGIYLPDKFGARIEDIVVAEKAGPRALNVSSRELHSVQ